MAVMVIPEALRVRLGDEASEDFTAVIKEIDLEARKDALAIAEERLEKKLTVEIGKVRVDIANEIGKVRVDLGNEIGGVRSEIGKVREDMLRLEGRLNERITSESGKVNERITSESGKVNERITSESGKLNERMSSLSERMTSLEGSNRLEMEKLRVDVAKSNTEIIRWMFLFWIGQLAAMAMLFRFFGK
jgi:hypothetical protein